MDGEPVKKKKIKKEQKGQRKRGKKNIGEPVDSRGE
jgi:hypothetical protein